MTRPVSSDRSHFRYCPVCGATLALREVGGRPRPCCDGCGFIQWRNPVVGVAGVIREGDIRATLGEAASAGIETDPVDGIRANPATNILLVRRANSFRGLWCLPCGYVEYDEEIRSALQRELLEETGLRTQIGSIVAVESNFHEPDKQSVGVWFHARPVGGRLHPGDDVDRIGFFPPEAPPALAFPTDARVLDRLARGLDLPPR